MITRPTLLLAATVFLASVGCLRVPPTIDVSCKLTGSGKALVVIAADNINSAGHTVDTPTEQIQTPAFDGIQTTFSKPGEKLISKRMFRENRLDAEYSLKAKGGDEVAVMFEGANKEIVRTVCR